MDKPPAVPSTPLTYRDAGLDLGLYEKTLAGMAPLFDAIRP